MVVPLLWLTVRFESGPSSDNRGEIMAQGGR